MVQECAEDLQCENGTLDATLPIEHGHERVMKSIFRRLLMCEEMFSELLNFEKVTERTGDPAVTCTL